MKILKYFSQEERDRRECQEDIKRLSLLSKMAEKAINVTYLNNQIWITVEGIPMFSVTNESDLNRRTIAIDQVELFINEQRANWIMAHKDDRLGGR